MYVYVAVVGGGGAWSCMLLLHPVLTCTDAGPDPCSLHPDLCILCLQWSSLAATDGGSVSSSAVVTKFHLYTWWFHPLQLAPVVFFLPPLAQRSDLCSGNLHCVLFFGGGSGGGGGRYMCTWW